VFGGKDKKQDKLLNTLVTNNNQVIKNQNQIIKNQNWLIKQRESHQKWIDHLEKQRRDHVSKLKTLTATIDAMKVRDEKLQAAIQALGNVGASQESSEQP